jgi:hypothetical protein
MDKCQICINNDNCNLVPKNNKSLACPFFLNIPNNQTSNFPEFKEFKKIPRLSREIIVTEKIDGTNGLIYIDENNNIFAGSRNRWLDDHNDNHGFWHWAMDNKEELLKLGKGYHYGEWMGQGIQRNYGLKEKRFYLFNVHKWTDETVRPKCCYVVPIIGKLEFNTEKIITLLEWLKVHGSVAVPGFPDAEGIVIFHTASGYLFKKTIENDEKGKEQ